MTARHSQQKRLEPIVEPLLSWYRRGHRDLPWRQNPHPYRVWVSEIMLQQTRVEAVKPYYERFLHALPTVQALADCPEEQLLKLWEGLGYYSRVRNLQKAAQQIVSLHGGLLPADYHQLKQLPGIGDYTAGAIASIAFDLPVPAVDGNVLRVLTRVTGCSDDISLPKTKEIFRQLLLEVEPQPGAGNFNQSLMELGATVCLPNGAPQCLLCPLAQLCFAHQQGQETDFPVKAPKKARRCEERTLLLFELEQDGERFTLLHRRPSKGVLAGMWEFPALEETATEQTVRQAAEELASTFGFSVQSVLPAKPSKHIFTHIEWRMTAWRISAKADLPLSLPEDFTLVRLRELNSDSGSSLALPSAFQAYRNF